MNQKRRESLHWILPLAFAMVMLLGITATVNATELQKEKLYVGGTDIVEESDHTVTGSGGGTAVLTYDNGGNPVLTLNSYIYSGPGHNTGSWNIGIYLKQESPLTIQLNGNSSITIVGDQGHSSGIYANYSSPITITGSGSLSCTGNNINKNGNDTSSYGIRSLSPLTIDGVTFKAIGGSVYGGTNSNDSFGISSSIVTVNNNGAVEATGGTASSNSSSSYGILAGVALNSGTVTAKGGSAKNSYGIYNTSTVTVTNGTLTAEGAAVSSPQKSFGIYGNKTDCTVSIGNDITQFTAAGSTCAMDRVTVTNAMAGTGWTDEAGTTGADTISVSETGQTVNGGFKKVVFAPGHTHDFTYTANSGDTITATCGGAGTCSLSDSKATLKIVKPTMTIYGQTGEDISAAATLTDAANLHGEATISYQKKTGDNTWSNASTGAPTDAGTYKASITLTGVKTGTNSMGDVTASVEYQIQKADVAAPENATVAGFVPNYLSENYQIGVEYEASSTNSDTATEVSSLTAILDNSDTPILFVRKKATNNTNASPWLTVNLTPRPQAPTGLTTENASSATSQDGKIKGTSAGMEFKQINRSDEWTVATETETLVKAGTYLVREKATSSAPAGKIAEVVVSANQTPTPGPSGGGIDPEPAKPTIEVPITSGENGVKVTATVDNSTIILGAISAEDLSKVPENEPLTLDFSNVKESKDGISSVILDTKTVENIANSAAASLEIRTASGTTVIGKAALTALAQQASAGTIQYVLNSGTKAIETMQTAQKETFDKLNNANAIEAYFISGGQKCTGYIIDYMYRIVLDPTIIGAKAKSASAKAVRAWYLKEDGSKEAIPCEYDGTYATLTLEYPAHYAIEEYDKAANNMSIKALTTKSKPVKVKAGKVKKANQSITAKKYVSIKNADGDITFEKVSGKAAFKVDANTGKITIKKGTKKGTYKVKVNVSAIGTADYLPAEKTITCWIKIK